MSAGSGQAVLDGARGRRTAGARARETRREDGGGTRALRRGEKRLLLALGVPALVLALAITVVTAYLPVVARSFTGSTTVIGLIVGSEGLIALVVPLIAGSWSDRLRTRLGRRLPFVLAGLPLMVAALVAMARVGSLTGLLVAVIVFFAGYYVAYEPYRALYPDLVADEIAGRAQSTQALWRGGGTVLALVGGGLLLSLGRGLPFAVAAAVLGVGLAGFAIALARRGLRRRGGRAGNGPLAAARQIWLLVREHRALRAFLIANGLWEMSLGALKVFIVLYLTQGMGISERLAAVLIGVTALFIAAGAAAGGRIGDRVGRARLLAYALPVYGAGLAVPLLFAAPWAVAPIMVPVGFGGGLIMSLPYAVLMPLMPERDHGALTGLFSLSRGVGLMLGPLLAGAAIQAKVTPASSTHGYAAMWLVCSAAILLSLLPLRSLRRASDDSAELRRA